MVLRLTAFKRRWPWHHPKATVDRSHLPARDFLDSQIENTQRPDLVDGVHRHRDDLAGGVTLATTWGAEDEDLILAGRKRHSRHQSGKVLVAAVVAGIDRGVIAGAKVEMLSGIRVGSGPHTALRVGVAVIVVVKVDCGPDNVFAWRQLRPTR